MFVGLKAAKGSSLSLADLRKVINLLDSEEKRPGDDALVLKVRVNFGGTVRELWFEELTK